jgi:hypothetical protein
LRALRAGNSTPPESLREYIFGLSLIALLYEQDYALRQDCQLVLDTQRARKRAKQAEEEELTYGKYRLALVSRDGTEESLDVTYDEAKKFAVGAASAFKIAQTELTITFDPKKMREAIKSATDDADTET